MTKKQRLIIVLLIIAVVLFSAVSFIIKPSINRTHRKQAQRQTDSLTHDISKCSKYKNKYVGNISNTANLFYNLPLNNINCKFSLDSQKCILTVFYLTKIDENDLSKVKRDLVYNSAAAFSLIDNLSAIKYEFSGNSFEFTRTDTEKIIGSLSGDILKKDIWKQKVTNKLSDEKFTEQFFSKKQ